MEFRVPGQGEDDDDAAAPWHDEAPEEPRGYVAEPAPAAPAEAPAEESEEEDMANVRWTKGVGMISWVTGYNGDMDMDKLDRKRS